MIDLRKGDCLELMKDMEDDSVDISFTSPPYNRKRKDKAKSTRKLKSLPN